MNVNNAGNAGKRRTVIYTSPRANSTEDDFREDLTLLETILSTYERTVAGLTRVLLLSDGGEEEVTTGKPP